MLKILVVEDNLTNQKVIVQQLRSLDYSADVVTSGKAAVEALAQTAYQVVFMDCRLPDIDGYTATRLVRQQEQQLGRTPAVIIALTASNDTQTQRAATAAGMDDFLTKPLRRDTLSTALQHWSQLLATTSAVDSATTHSDTDLVNLEPEQASAYSPSALWEQHFDLQQLHQLSDHNPEFEQELLQLYLNDTQDQLQQLQPAIDKPHFVQIERIAHHLKGASASVGARQLEQLAGELELQAKQQQQSQIIDLAERLDRAFDQIQLLLKP